MRKIFQFFLSRYWHTYCWKLIALYFLENPWIPLSTGGDPRLAGYSQSRSKPSKPWVRRYEIEFWINSSRELALETIALNVAEPWVQPPTAKVTLRDGFWSLIWIDKLIINMPSGSSFNYFHCISNCYISTKLILLPMHKKCQICRVSTGRFIWKTKPLSTNYLSLYG